MWKFCRLLIANGFMWLSLCAFAECDFDDFPTMPDMKLFSVMENAQYNNRPMMVKGYTVDATLEQVANYYYRVWKDRADSSKFGHWYQVSTLTDDCMMTVQIANNEDQSQGRLVISNVPTIDPGAEIGEDLLAPSDAVVVSDLHTQDGPKKGRVSMLASASATAEVESYYRANMGQAGWQLEHSFAQDEAKVLVFRKGLSSTNVLIVPAGDITQILISEEMID